MNFAANFVSQMQRHKIKTTVRRNPLFYQKAVCALFPFSFVFHCIVGTGKESLTRILHQMEAQRLQSQSLPGPSLDVAKLIEHALLVELASYTGVFFPVPTLPKSQKAGVWASSYQVFFTDQLLVTANFFIWSVSPHPLGGWFRRKWWCSNYGFTAFG